LPTADVQAVTTPEGVQEFATYHLTVPLGADDAIWQVKSSADLTAWADPVVFFMRVDNGNGTETRSYRSTTPVQMESRRFFKAAVTLP
jgi:hypothetical protein